MKENWKKKCFLKNIKQDQLPNIYVPFFVFHKQKLENKRKKKLKWLPHGT